MKVRQSEVEYLKILLSRTKSSIEAEKLREEIEVKEAILLKQHNELIMGEHNDGQRMA